MNKNCLYLHDVGADTRDLSFTKEEMLAQYGSKNTRAPSKTPRAASRARRVGRTEKKRPGLRRRDLGCLRRELAAAAKRPEPRAARQATAVWVFARRVRRAAERAAVRQNRVKIKIKIASLPGSKGAYRRRDRRVRPSRLPLRRR